MEFLPCTLSPHCLTLHSSLLSKTQMSKLFPIVIQHLLSGCTRGGRWSWKYSWDLKMGTPAQDLGIPSSIITNDCLLRVFLPKQYELYIFQHSTWPTEDIWYNFVKCCCQIVKSFERKTILYNNIC